MECPRCRLDMEKTEYEGEKVRFCPTCWGYFLGRDQLMKIVADIGYEFGASETQAVEASFDKGVDTNREGTEEKPIPCPLCSHHMDRKKFHASCPVEIDECEEHGIWLDTGEIKDLQVFIENFMQG